MRTTPWFWLQFSRNTQNAAKIVPKKNNHLLNWSSAIANLYRNWLIVTFHCFYSHWWINFSMSFLAPLIYQTVAYVCFDVIIGWVCFNCWCCGFYTGNSIISDSDDEEKSYQLIDRLSWLSIWMTECECD